MTVGNHEFDDVPEILSIGVYKRIESIMNLSFFINQNFMKVPFWYC